jgi:hypothetical protein
MQKYNSESHTRNVSDSLKRLLQKYNDFLLNDKKATSNYNLKRDNLYFIPNNGNKFHCFISERPKQSSILQFFSRDPIDTFFIETNKVFVKQVILEGYLYDAENDKKEYCITDILIYNGDILNVSYENRLKLLYSLFTKKTLVKFANLNDHLTFYIHPSFNSRNKHLIDVYNLRKKTFIETIDDFYKTNVKIPVENNDIVYEKLIDKGAYSDVYNVYNASTMDNDGILYIRTIDDSRKLYKMFKDKQDIKIHVKCRFNNKFNKYYMWDSL